MGGLILHKLNKYIPAEDTALAAFFYWVFRLLSWTKALCVIVGILVILKAVQLLGNVYTGVPPVLIKGVSKFIASFFPFFLDLIFASFSYLWLPIVLYMLVALLTKSLFWRKFWCLVGVSGFFLFFVSTLQEASWKEYEILPLLILQGYLFMLWLLPQEAWNIIGLTISSVLGLIILIMPDLPSAFDDFGLFGAVLAFFLGYLNLLASLIQRAVYRI